MKKWVLFHLISSDGCDLFLLNFHAMNVLISHYTFVFTFFMSYLFLSLYLTTKKNFDQDLWLASGQNIFPTSSSSSSTRISSLSKMNGLRYTFLYTHTPNCYIWYFIQWLWRRSDWQIQELWYMTRIIRFYNYKIIVWRSLNTKEYQPST